MTEIRRLSDSCLLVTIDEDATMFDPGFHTYLDWTGDLDSVGDVTRVLVTHEHGDHVHPDFVKWLIDRRSDLVVYSNQAVADLLAGHDIEVSTDVPAGVTVEDVLHERLPNGARPPNRSWTIDGLITHPGDSHEPTVTAPILALPMIAPWGSLTAAVDFARRIRPDQVVMIHDFFMSEQGRTRIRSMAKSVLADAGIEVLDLDWGDHLTI
ncbi:MAG TPA: MBL fold metallo-hydrolase [Acidimicrobiia bacterium]|nr:MBL fold metallo-hydrolase [Acidimicrobiia bacterium]